MLDEAIANSCNLIIAHHPLIFKGLKSLTGKHWVERCVIKAIKNLNPKNKAEKFYILDRNGRIVKKSENLDKLINKVEWTNLKLVR